jgi:hypothetical protein
MLVHQRSCCHVLCLGCKHLAISHHLIARRSYLCMDSFCLFSIFFSLCHFFSACYYCPNYFYVQSLMLKKHGTSEPSMHINCLAFILYWFTKSVYHMARAFMVFMVWFCGMCATTHFHITNVLTLSFTQLKYIGPILMRLPFHLDLSVCVLEKHRLLCLLSEIFWCI